MFNSFRKLIAKETSVEKREREAREARERQENTRIFQIKMQTWQSQFQLDTGMTPHEVATLEHNGSVDALTQLSNGKLASGSKDYTIRLWDVARTECGASLFGHMSKVYTLIQLSDGRLASGSGDKTIRVWNLNTMECVTILRGHTGYVWALIQLPNGCLVSGSGDKTIRVWNLNTMECVMLLRGHADYVCALTQLPDGRLASGSVDNTIRLWDVGLRSHHETVVNINNSEKEEVITPKNKSLTPEQNLDSANSQQADISSALLKSSSTMFSLTNPKKVYPYIEPQLKQNLLPEMSHCYLTSEQQFKAPISIKPSELESSSNEVNWAYQNADSYLEEERRIAIEKEIEEQARQAYVNRQKSKLEDAERERDHYVTWYNGEITDYDKYKEANERIEHYQRKIDNAEPNKGGCLIM